VGGRGGVGGGGNARQRRGVFVLKQNPQIRGGDQREQPPPPLETARKLEVGEIGAAVAAPQPVLLLGEIVVANPRPMQLAKRGAGGTEIGTVAIGLGNLQGHPIDPAAHEDATSGKEQRWRDAELASNRKPLAFTPEQMMGHGKAPPWPLVDTAQHRLDLACRRREAAALHGRERVTFEHHAARPASLDFGRQAHRSYSAAAARSAPVIQRSRSTSARRVSARFLASAFCVPRSRCPLSPLTACASGGKRPKLTFIGWYE